MSEAIDVFDIHSCIMEDYKKFVGSFIKIQDETIKKEVDKGIAAGKFWPEPLISFNPSFEKGQSLQELCTAGILHPEMAEIFKGFNLYHHQSEAIKTGSSGYDFVVTSGTGSGKSLAFLATIFNYLLQHKKSENRKGIKAVIVYPMNALINSQFDAIVDLKNQFEKNTGKEFPFTFARYTGQEKQEERENSRQELPDIILTNYMMLELILTRPQEMMLRDSLYEHLRYLVFDELHTYRGRQGADVAMLVARVKAQAKLPVSCIGTSATMVSGGSLRDQKMEVAAIAGKLFGCRFSEEQIIDEYLTRCFEYNGALPTSEMLKQILENVIDPLSGESDLVKCPLSTWIENSVALKEIDGRLTRNIPLRFSEIAAKLSAASGLPTPICESRLKTYLKWISHVNETTAAKKVFYLPYKIHQFISQTGAVYASLHKGPDRVISLDPTPFKKKGEKKIPLFPLVFSRESGHEFIGVTLSEENSCLTPREFAEIDEEEENNTAGYLIPSAEVWNPDTDMELLPGTWIKTNRKGEMKPGEAYRSKMPRRIYYDERGNFSFETPLQYEGWFMTAKLLFDPTSGVIYDPRTSENTKLTRLGSEGRSTSTTVLNFSILKQLAKHGFQYDEQKVLSFTDNRQDAALQSGHFNDFLKVAQLRSAIYHALGKNGELDHTNLDQAVFDALALDRWRKMYREAGQQLDDAHTDMKGGVHTPTSKQMKNAHSKYHQALKQKALLENKTENDGQGYSEFYPYRYLASEGFLPGYNFTRLPVRAFIPRGDSGEYVSRPRFIAVREFGPGNIVYHNGAKFRVDQLLLPEIDKNLKKAKVSKNSGCILMDQEYDANNCPFTGVSLTESSSKELFVDLLPMPETRTVEIDRISCAEEERMSRGYEIDTYFSIPGGIDTLRKAKVKNQDQGFLNLTFIPASRLVLINKKWRISRQSGFLIGLRSGMWKKAAAKEKDDTSEEERLVQLYTHDTADALYIEPVKALALTPNGVITLMYALKRAIENIFQVEPAEINVQLMGDEAHPNIFIYEDAEGSLGILSQFISARDIFNEAIDEAYNLCRYHDPDYLEEASYDDLLSYYNQRHHKVINRFEIQDALEKLKTCHVELGDPRFDFDYDAHYRHLLKQIDPHSAMEERLLNYLYREGLRLPDGAQQITADVYCRPDFYYDPDIHVFCDGTPHDSPEVQEMDKKRREALRNSGKQVLVWHYKERLEDFIARRPDIFKKVK